MSLIKRGKVSAKDVCILALLAKQCGATSPSTDLSFQIDAPSGHYQRHLTAALHLDEPLECAYTMEFPAREKHAIERTTIEIPALPSGRRNTTSIRLSAALRLVSKSGH